MTSPRDGSPYWLSNEEGSVLKSNTQTTKIDYVHIHTHMHTYIIICNNINQNKKLST